MSYFVAAFPVSLICTACMAVPLPVVPAVCPEVTHPCQEPPTFALYVTLPALAAEFNRLSVKASIPIPLPVVPETLPS